MGTRVRVMDLEVDLLTKETLESEIRAYLSTEYLNTVHMISLDYVDTYDKNELVRQVLGEADMILPGEKAILSAHHVEVLETGGMVVDYHGVLDMVNDNALAESTIYLIVRDEKEAKVFYRYAARHFSKEKILGVSTTHGDMTEEGLVNDINTRLPDIVLLSLDSTEQEEWLQNNKSRINARLCLAMGSITPIIMRENVHVPSWIKALHLDRIYRRILRVPYSHRFRRRIFYRKMDDYITKKKWRDG